MLKELKALPDFPADGRLRWASPLEDDRFLECYDRAYLRAVGREDLWSDLRNWWPRRGPQWDALAVVEAHGGDVGPVLIEAKSYPREQYSRGTAAKGSEPDSHRYAVIRDPSMAWR